MANKKKTQQQLIKKPASKARGILRLILPAIPVALAGIIGTLMLRQGWFEILSTDIMRIVSMAFGITILVAAVTMGIVTLKMHRSSPVSLLVINAIFLGATIFLWTFVANTASTMMKSMFGYELDIKNSWMIFLVPCVNFAVSTIAFVLFEIPDKFVRLWKMNVSITIGGVASLALSLTMLVTYLLENPFSSAGGILRFCGLIATLITAGMQFIVAPHSYEVKDSGVNVTLDTVWIGFSIVAVITSIFGIIILIILIIALIVLTALAIGAGSAAGGRPYHDKQDRYGGQYHTNADGTVTKSDGSKWRPIDNSGVYKKVS